ncbi:regulatory LuxR family protein [Saccharopolyspora spinosa]|uniref:Regulatory LuxR family protein n=2 Tax=Saccharopolyspora spinosa TaxID=60894 RepID=A0A2N3Y6X7_SACSN|nr:regulatory LuxR family protein [Saccharopolyspora spinosa]
MHGLDWPHERWSLTDSFESDPLLTTTSSHTVDEAPFSAGSHEPATHAAIRSHYPDRPTSVVAAVRALLSRGWIESAVMLAEATLNDGVPEGLAAELRCTLIAPLITSGHTAEAIAIADRVLAVPDLATTTFDDTAAGRMLALVLQGDFASDHASKVLQEPDRTCHGQARTAIALTGLAHLEWSAGNVAGALCWGRRAATCAASVKSADWRWYPPLMMAEMLGELGEFDDAEKILRQARAEIDQFGLTMHAAQADLIRARLLLRAGRQTAARLTAEACLSSALELGTWRVVPSAESVLALIAFRSGDAALARSYLRRCRETSTYEQGSAARSARDEWIQLLVHTSKEDPSSIEALLHTNLLHRPALFVEEPGAAAWFVRVAMDVGDEKIAIKAIEAAQAVANANIGTPAVATGALHARSLFERNLDGLLDVISEYGDAWARETAIEDLRALLGGGVRSSDWPDSRNVAESGRNDSANAKNTDGLPGKAEFIPPELTETERAIAELVSQGLTNRQIAHRVFLSPHTVNYHLRRIFRKLGINSRVELASQERYAVRREIRSSGRHGSS